MAKVKKPSKFGIIMIAVAVVGLILTIVGVAIDAIAMSYMGIKAGVGMFDLHGSPTKLPGAVVEAVAALTLVAAILSCILVLLNAIGLVKLPKAAKLGLGIATVLFAVLTVVFAFIFVGELPGFKIDAGPFLVAIGGLAAGIPLFLVKE